MTGAGMATFSKLLGPFLLAWLLVMPHVARADACMKHQGMTAPLQRFYQALDALKAGKRHEVRVLHLGDSHITLDHLTGALRTKWVTQFGDAGRGLPAGVPYQYYAPQGFAISMEGTWDVASSFRASTPGPFGMQGFRLTSNNPQSAMRLQRSDGATISGVTIDVAGGPNKGAFYLTLGAAGPLKLDTRRATAGFMQLQVPAAQVSEMRLSPVGNGPVQILGWAVSTGRPGIRYDSYGIVGATAQVMDNWTPAIMRDQLKRLAPDLVIYGYGTNEGFDDRLDLQAERERFHRFMLRMRDAAPEASIAVLGAFDGARIGTGAGATCGDGLETPPMLDALREMMRAAAAAEGAWFWDGAAAMGGRCAITRWSKAEPMLAWPDHVHLRPEGARVMGAALGAALMAGYGSDEGTCGRPD